VRSRHREKTSEPPAPHAVRKKNRTPILGPRVTIWEKKVSEKKKNQTDAVNGKRVPGGSQAKPKSLAESENRILGTRHRRATRGTWKKCKPPQKKNHWVNAARVLPQKRGESRRRLHSMEHRRTLSREWGYSRNVPFKKVPRWVRNKNKRWVK